MNRFVIMMTFSFFALVALENAHPQQPNDFEWELIRSQYYHPNHNPDNDHERTTTGRRLLTRRLSTPLELYGENKFYDLRSELKIIYDSMHEPVYVDEQHERVLRYDHSLDNPFQTVTKEYSEQVRGIWDARLRAWSKQETHHQTKRAIHRADFTSLPLRIMRKLKGLLGGSNIFGGQEEQDPAITDVRTRNDIAIHREEHERREREKLLHPAYSSYKPDALLPTPKEPKKLRFRSRMNALKRQANVTVENPLVTTSANYNQKALDKVELKAHRRVPLVDVESTFSYGIQHKTIVMNVHKQLSREWSCEFESTKSDHSDIQTQQSLRLNYLFRF